MEKKYTITLRLSYQQHAWLGALCRRSKQTQSEVIRSLIENGSVRERITQEHIHIIRQLIGERLKEHRSVVVSAMSSKRKNPSY